jgi:hypothetical protein
MILLVIKMRALEQGAFSLVEEIKKKKRDALVKNPRKP